MNISDVFISYKHKELEEKNIFIFNEFLNNTISLSLKEAINIDKNLYSLVIEKENNKYNIFFTFGKFNKNWNLTFTIDNKTPISRQSYSQNIIAMRYFEIKNAEINNDLIFKNNKVINIYFIIKRFKYFLKYHMFFLKLKSFIIIKLFNFKISKKDNLKANSFFHLNPIHFKYDFSFNWFNITFIQFIFSCFLTFIIFFSFIPENHCIYNNEILTLLLVLFIMLFVKFIFFYSK